MNFAPDDFASIHRRKRLAAWLMTLKGPKKIDHRAELVAAYSMSAHEQLAQWKSQNNFSDHFHNPLVTIGSLF